MHPVLVDGIKGVATTGTLGTYSDRIVLSLEEEHPDLGKEFGTKHFIFKSLDWLCGAMKRRLSLSTKSLTKDKSVYKVSE